KDDCTTFRHHGYAQSGRWATRRTQFVHNIWYSVLPALGIDGFFACEVVEGSFTCLSYEKFILQEVLPQMNSVPELYSVLIMDNAKIHKSQHVVDLATTASIVVEFLAL
ncbi:hypothetical protein L873DRAFT_1595216, partial [Choiromyces venosus 120613-1]